MPAHFLDYEINSIIYNYDGFKTCPQFLGNSSIYQWSISPLPRTWTATNEKNMMEVRRLLSLGGTRQCRFQLALSERSLLKPSFYLHGSLGHSHAPCPADSPQISDEDLKVTQALATIWTTTAGRPWAKISWVQLTPRICKDDKMNSVVLSHCFGEVWYTASDKTASFVSFYF